MRCRRQSAGQPETPGHSHSLDRLTRRPGWRRWRCPHLDGVTRQAVAWHPASSDRSRSRALVARRIPAATDQCQKRDAVGCVHSCLVRKGSVGQVACRGHPHLPRPASLSASPPLCQRQPTACPGLQAQGRTTRPLPQFTALPAKPARPRSGSGRARLLQQAPMAEAGAALRLAARPVHGCRCQRLQGLRQVHG